LASSHKVLAPQLQENLAFLRSIMTTASYPGGMGSPVSTQTICEPTARLTGEVSVAPLVSAARTAIPSMAEAS
jgi:hypothetical protein